MYHILQRRLFYVLGKIGKGSYQKLVFQWGPGGELQVHFFLKYRDDYVFSVGKGGGPKYPPFEQLFTISLKNTATH